VDGLRVAELAESAGVPASTVRYYERLGLLPPARRADNGYRLFDSSAVDALVFIKRAKGIGMSLEEIIELVTAWPDTECRLLQASLRRFLGKRIDQVEAQRRELEAFRAQLSTVLRRLASRDPGPELCGKGCSCESDLDVTGEESVAGRAAWGCSLDDDSLGARLAEWRELTAAARSVCQDGDAVRLVFAADPDVVAAVASLCAKESGCCAPARFRLDIGAEELTVTARAPGAPGILEALFPQDSPPHG